jgi:hypothetical protein
MLTHITELTHTNGLLDGGSQAGAYPNPSNSYGSGDHHEVQATIHTGAPVAEPDPLAFVAPNRGTAHDWSR